MFAGPSGVVFLSCDTQGAQVLKARSEDVSGAFLLFPSLCNMAATPNGRKLSVSRPRNPISNYEAKLSNQRFFRPPMPLVAALLSPLLRILPNFVYTAIYRAWPAPQLNILRDLLRSPTAIYACLTLADEEMKTIVGLDGGLMNEQQHKLWLYFAEYDDWVGESKERVINTFHPDHKAIRVVHGETGIPHAFCIGEFCIWLTEFLPWLISCLQLKLIVGRLLTSPLFGYKRVDSCEMWSSCRCIFTLNK